MTRYIARRLLAFLPVMLIMSFLIFLIIELVPGDPVAYMLGEGASGEAREALRHALGFDRPLIERMANWYVKVLHGNLGNSFFLQTSVTKAILSRLPVTYSLATFALIVAGVLGLTAGIAASLRPGGFFDTAIMALAMLGLSIPGFWLALNLIFLFAVNLDWMPLGGFVSPKEGIGDYFMHLVMPGVSLGIMYAAMIARMTRASMLEVLGIDYIRTARAKGLKERIVILRHALKNALIPIITMFGVAAGGLLGGSAITETVFNLPGVGRLIVDGILRRDFTVLQGGILTVSLTYLAINLVVDILYVWANPRIRYE
jgi:peptide/nickel transport system permease protein